MSFTILKFTPTAKFGVLIVPGDGAATAEKVAAPVSKETPSSESNGSAKAQKGQQQPKAQQQEQTKQQKKGKQAKPAEPPKAARPWTDELQKDYDRIFSVGEECISGPELKTLLTVKGRGSDSAGFNLYDGFEPSGRMHIAQGVFKAMNVNKCTFKGTNSTFVFWVADWFALMNDKMGGDLEKIKTVGHYLIEVWKAAGMDLSNVVFKWASEEITGHADKYWPTMLDVARRFNITRIKKCCQIMGRLEGSLTSAQILYPLMQCTDVFFLKADICQLGVDQRKVNMLAREYCDAAGIKHKPIILSHHMLYGLKAGQEKMSKSDPDSAVFMEDAVADVERKIMNAYCPRVAETPTTKTTAETEDAGKESMHLTEDNLKNPCLDYIENIIFSPPDATFTAGTETFPDYLSVREAFVSGKISEEELKQGLIKELNRLLEPVRSHFTNDERARDLLAKVQQYKKEAKLGVTEKVVRRLNLVAAGKVKPGSHLVFAPLPSANPTLQGAVDVLASLRQADAPRVLFLSDWTARVCNACLADAKAIAASHSVLIAALKALDPSLMETTDVILQSEAILVDPSNYWINVINVGRHFMLNDVMGSNISDSDGVGAVIARLMRVADAAGVEAKSIAFTENETAKIESSLIERFFAEKLPGVVSPTTNFVSSVSVRLQKEKESEALKNENDEYFLLDSPQVNGGPKMKKSFCEPGNVAFCPPIRFLEVFVFGPPESGSFDIKRSAENGGDKKYESIADLEADFASGSLHPGDMKPPIVKIATRILEKISKGISGDAPTKKAAGALKTLQKKIAKQKK